MKYRIAMQDVKEEFDNEKNQVEILERKNSTTQIKTQLKASPTEWCKLKIQNQGLTIK
jgi:hypothetical protein